MDKLVEIRGWVISLNIRLGAGVHDMITIFWRGTVMQSAGYFSCISGNSSALMGRWIMIAMVVFALLMGGCATYQVRDRTIKLENQAEVYIKAIRWNSFETIAPLFRNRDGSVPALNLEKYQDIRVTRGDYKLQAADSQALEATMSATFDYQKRDSAVIGTVKQLLLWWYDEDANLWFIEGSLPAF